METRKTEALRAVKIHSEIEHEKTRGEPPIEVEFRDTTEKASMQSKKEEASKLLYLARYE